MGTGRAPWETDDRSWCRRSKKITYPAEYNLYQRLGIRSVLGASLEPRPVALLAVTQSQAVHFRNEYSAAVGVCSSRCLQRQKWWMTVWTWLSLQKTSRAAMMFLSVSLANWRFTPPTASCEKPIWNPQKFSRLLTYLLISGKKAHSSLEIAQALWPDDSTNPAKNMRNLIYRLRQTFGLISEKWAYCIYRFRLSIQPWSSYYDGLSAIWRSYPVGLESLFRYQPGRTVKKLRLTSIVEKFLSSADGEHWFIQFTAKYHIAYVGAVNELLKQLNALHSYDLLISMLQSLWQSSLKTPEDTTGWFTPLKFKEWMIGLNEYQLAKQHLTTEEYKNCVLH